MSLEPRVTVRAHGRCAAMHHSIGKHSVTTTVQTDIALTVFAAPPIEYVDPAPVMADIRASLNLRYRQSLPNTWLQHPLLYARKQSQSSST